MKKNQPYGGNLKALDALFGDAPTAAGELVSIEQIRPNPDQPRRYFGESELESLAASIEARGVLQPLLVRPLADGALELVAGERRYRAAKRAGLSEVPAVVRELSDGEALELALLENLQREDLNPVEETDAVLGLLSARLNRSVTEVSSLIRVLRDEERGRTPAGETAKDGVGNNVVTSEGESGNNVVTKDERTVITDLFTSLGKLTVSSFYTHRLPLLKLPDTLLDATRSGQLHYSKARELAKVADVKARDDLLRRTLEDDLSLTELKALIGEISGTGDDATGERLTKLKRNLTPKRWARLSKRDKARAEKLLEELEALISGG